MGWWAHSYAPGQWTKGINDNHVALYQDDDSNSSNSSIQEKFVLRGILTPATFSTLIHAIKGSVSPTFDRAIPLVSPLSVLQSFFNASPLTCPWLWYPPQLWPFSQSECTFSWSYKLKTFSLYMNLIFKAYALLICSLSTIETDETHGMIARIKIMVSTGKNESS